jgi:dihydrodipicolinate synthase/N-acetylneuraminate lyase
VNAEDIDRIEATHGPSVNWQNGAVGWICMCGNGWPCEVLRLADDARKAQAAIKRGYQDRGENEFWVSDE